MPINFQHKNFVRVSDLQGDELPPMPSKNASVLANFDDVTAGIPIQEKEKNADGEERHK